jgi:hypothetical protein
MAEMLISLIDRENKDLLGSVIDIKPNGWLWGSKEGLPNFCLVKVPGESVQDLVSYIEQTQTRKYKWRLDLANMDSGIKQKLTVTSGFIEVKTPGGDYNNMKQFASLLKDRDKE